MLIKHFNIKNYSFLNSLTLDPSDLFLQLSELLLCKFWVENGLLTELLASWLRRKHSFFLPYPIL